jgi:hypothetical protein
MEMCEGSKEGALNAQKRALTVMDGPPPDKKTLDEILAEALVRYAKPKEENVTTITVKNIDIIRKVYVLLFLKISILYTYNKAYNIP